MKSTKSWIQIKIATSKDVAEKLADELFTLGALSVTFEDSFDTPIFEPKLECVTLWTDTTVVALFDHDFNLELIKDKVFTKEIIEDKDWEREWMQDFHPIKFGQRLWICPTWLPIPEPDAVNVLLDPGLAFGSGTHATTALCLEWLEEQDIDSKSLIDFGCGSGILAIAGLKLGAKRAIGIDIDHQAISASLENAKRNNCDSKLELYLSGDEPFFQTDFLVANILAKPLYELAPHFATILKDKGKFAISGILNEQAQDLKNHFSKWFKILELKQNGDWSLISGEK